MRYEVSYSKEATRTLRKLPRNVAEAITAKIKQLAAAPKDLANNVKKLIGSDFYRLRVGDYRVIYMMNSGKMIITVVKIGARGDVYK